MSSLISLVILIMLLSSLSGLSFPPFIFLGVCYFLPVDIWRYHSDLFFAYFYVSALRFADLRPSC
jgi:hypothetical protein